MLRDITIGQYYPTGSVIHRMDPRVKLFGTLVFLISVFAYKGIVGLAIVTLFLASVIAISKVPFRYMIKGLKAIMILMLITALFNLFLTPGEVLIQIWKLKITKEGLMAAIRMAIRLTYLILGTSLMTLTTTPNQLTDGLERLLSPLKKIHVPVHELAMMMSLALRFIPTLVEETDKIMGAQRARGADFDNGNLLHRARAMVPILVPLFVSAFRRADELATAMECRLYRGDNGRTRLRQLKFGRDDAKCALTAVVFVGGAVVLQLVL